MARAIFFIIWLLSFHLSHGHTHYPQEIKCPVDQKKFIIYVTGSYTTFKTLTDFQKQGAIGDLYESYVNSCPQCHYSGYKGDFDTTFSDTTRENILKILEPYKDSKMTDVLENEITVKIYQYFNRSNNEIADLYLVASYFLKGKSSLKEKRIEMQRKSADFYIKAVENRDYKKKETYATIYYLIGELNRRAGDFDNSIKYFELAINDKDKKDWIKDLASKQKELAVQKNDDNSL